MARVTALVLLAVATAAAATACGASPAVTSEGSGVYGTVKRGPLRPVCVRGAKCYAPAKKAVLTFASASRIVARVRTTGRGTYRVALRPGRYSVRSKLGIGGLKPTTVRVRKGRFARLDLVIDTGIR